MFPEIDKETLSSLLLFHHGNLEAAATSLLDTMVTPDSTDLDEQMAAEMNRQEQLAIDDEIAKQLHATLQEELKAERKQSELTPRAMAAAAALKKRIASLTARPKKERATRLLDADSASDNFGPLYSPSPLMPSYSPPEAVMAAPDTLPIVEEARVAETPTQYNARLARARSANRQTSHSRMTTTRTESDNSPIAPIVLSLSDATPATPSPEAPHVPEGQLI